MIINNYKSDRNPAKEKKESVKIVATDREMLTCVFGD